MRNIYKKTVFILGAGFSKADNLPLQSELLKQIFTLFPEETSDNSSFLNLSINIVEQNIMRYYEEFEKSRHILADFLIENFLASEKKNQYYSIKALSNSKLPIIDDQLKNAYKIASEVNVTLEDLFTIFDKIILGHEHFQLYSSENIINIHKALRSCIIFLLSYRCAQASKNNDSVYKLFSNKIFNIGLNTSSINDNISIITMNWDSLLENEFYRLCQNHNSNNPQKMIYPDLCFNDDSYKENEKHIMSTYLRAKGYNNIKFIKLHGSINWLGCPYCGRLYVDFIDDIALNELLPNCFCPICKNNIVIENSPQLYSILITPTFLKDLNNLHLKNIWHNALINLIEAEKIIFIGYSFPDADFEMRCLLKKAVQPNTHIEIVLHHFDNPEYYISRLEKYNLNTNEKNIIIDRLNLPEKRYKAFFGNKVIKLYYNGIENYIKQEMMT
jgi:hypothetical protein